MRDFEIPGVWWLPSIPDDRVPGTVTFTQSEGIRLKLFGVFGKDALRTFGGAPMGKKEARILGVTEAGKRMTLIDCFVMNAQFGVPGYAREEYDAKVAYNGAHFSEDGDIRFSGIEVSFTHLTDWVGDTGFKGQRVFTPKGALERYELTYSFPPDVKATTPLGEVAITHSFHQGGDHWREVRLGQTAWFRIDPASPLSLDEALVRLVRPLEMFVTMATGAPNRILQLNVYPSDTTEHEGHAADGRAAAAVEVIFNETGPRAPEGVRPRDMLFTFDAVRERFPDAIARWLTFAQDYRSVLNVFFANHYDRSRFVDQRFLDLARAAEAYHRKRHGRSDRSKEDHESRVNAILTVTPEEHHEWLAERLEHSDEATLRYRLRQLIQDQDAVMAPFVGKDRKTLINRLVKTRNELTHLAEEGAGVAPNLREIFEMNEVLGLLLEACLLRELEFPSERVAQLLAEYPRYQWAVRRARAEWGVQ